MVGRNSIRWVIKAASLHAESFNNPSILTGWVVLLAGNWREEFICEKVVTEIKVAILIVSISLLDIAG